MMSSLPPKTYFTKSSSSSWEEILEASTYYERIAELLEHARQYVVFVGWQVDSRLRFQKPFPETLKEKLIRLCNEKPGFQVFFLVWDHALVYCLEREFWQRRIWDKLHPQIHFVFDNRHPFGGSHHEKIVLIDHRIALCGGVDLCDERWDSSHHFYSDQRRSLNWKEEQHGPYHDLAVQVTGPICQEIYAHISKRWNRLSSTPLPIGTENPIPTPAQNQAGHTVFLSRTHAEIDAAPHAPLIIREIELLYRSLIQKANQRIFIEGQYYLSKRINEFLISKMNQMQGKPFEIYLILCDLRNIKSLTRLMTSYQLGLLTSLHQAAQKTQTNLNLLSPVVTPYTTGNPDTPLRPKPVYIHSKLIIVDDRFISIGSANLASRALRIDSEMQLTFEARTSYEHTHIQNFFEQSLQHWDCKPSLTLRSINPEQERAQLRGTNPISSKIPWQIFFDPQFPISFALKRVCQNIGNKNFGPILLKLFLFLIWISGALLTALTSGSLHPWSLFYAFFLSTVWIYPVPFILISLLICLHLDDDIAPVLIVHAFLISSLLGYFMDRIFPNFSKKLFHSHSFHPFGPRSFQNLMAVLFNPRLSMHTKIHYPGLYFAPLAWFVPACLIVFPVALFVFFKMMATILSP